MDCDAEVQQVMSLRLSRVLRDIGVSKYLVAQRRNTFLKLEKLSHLIDSTEYNIRCVNYFVGSQSEGTTTLGMESDIDAILRADCFSVIMDWAEWNPGNICLLVIKNEHSPPQHCCLQILKRDCPLPETLDNAKLEVEETMDGKLLLKNTWIEAKMKQDFGRFYRKQGPSRSFSKDADHIFAFSYERPIFECTFLFRRPKPGHWPRPAILAKARLCETFLVPQGHAESDQSKLEWRFSTPLIERLLMFDLNIQNIQAYTLLKILRKSFFKPLVGDRLSTFHFKTALLFTLETYPPEIGQERNLLQCVINCLKTLQRWFKHRHCPHYTISGVDLFVGKLRKWEFPLLSAVLSDMIDNIMHYLFQIEMDQIGERIVGGPNVVRTRYNNAVVTGWICFKYFIETFFTAYWNLLKERKDILEILNYIIRVRESLSESDMRVDLQHAERFLYQYIATMMASMCLQRNQLIQPGVYRLYEASQWSDLTSSRLKMASMMYCSGQYEMAKLVLTYTEGLLHADVLQWGPTPGRASHEPTEKFRQKTYTLPFLEVIKRHIGCSVMFNSLEVCCVPGFLVYEMHRTNRPEDFHKRHPIVDTWMDLIVIDSKPFMFYLQYLTFRQLGEEERRLEALAKLYNYVYVESRGRGHIDTALHVLGHCYELENEYDLAWACYRKSLDFFPYNNAARWHILRLLQ